MGRNENKADTVPYIITAEVGAPLIGAAATPDGEHPYIDGRAIVVAEGKVVEIKGEPASKIAPEKDAEIEKLKAEISEKDAEIEKLNKVEAYSTAQDFEVVNEYAGIEVGTIVPCTDRGRIAHMVEQGYWKEV